ncbi:MAG: hypothetical protein JXR94_08625 [Candidatus Hydrogenedentes bacterium]|nr:hypothetical protein [Candidatus Hydrogenedentota bacterium]
MNDAAAQRTGTPNPAKRASRKFFYWYIAIQCIPLVGIPATWPNINRVWVLIAMANTCVFFFNLARHRGRRGEGDAKRERLLLFVIAAMWAAMVVCWGALMAVGIYRSGTLRL